MNAIYGQAGSALKAAVPWFDEDEALERAKQLAYEDACGDAAWDVLRAAVAVAYAKAYYEDADELDIARALGGAEAWSRLSGLERTRLLTDAAFEHFEGDLERAGDRFWANSGITAPHADFSAA